MAKKKKKPTFDTDLNGNSMREMFPHEDPKYKKKDIGEKFICQFYPDDMYKLDQGLHGLCILEGGHYDRVKYIERLIRKSFRNVMKRLEECGVTTYEHELEEAEKRLRWAMENKQEDEEEEIYEE